MNDNGAFVYLQNNSNNNNNKNSDRIASPGESLSYERQLKYLLQSCNWIKFITSKIICGVILIRKRLMI